MIEPVFIGLLAAAFAFMYPQLMRLALTMLEDLRRPGAFEAILKLSWEKAEGKVAMSEEAFAAEVGRLWVVGAGKVMRIPVVSLVIYVLSLSVVVGGYLVSGYWVPYGEWTVNVGVVLLMGSLIMCGGQLAHIMYSAGGGMRKLGDEVKRLMLKESRKG